MSIIMITYESVTSDWDEDNFRMA